jgi:hypothetical protein
MLASTVRRPLAVWGPEVTSRILDHRLDEWNNASVDEKAHDWHASPLTENGV